MSVIHYFGCNNQPAFIAWGISLHGMQAKPNILIIMCDQLSSWGLSCYGGTEVDTPHIDRLAGEGARCNQYFCNVALCTPSRACFMTSRYPQQNGIYQESKALGDDQITIAHQLNKAGYRTGYSGKWHLAGAKKAGQTAEQNWQPDLDGGWEDSRYMWNNGHFKHVEMNNDGTCPQGERHRIGDERSYASDWLTDRTIEYIKEQNGNDDEQPFAYMVSFPDPHQPYRAREPYASQFPAETVTIPSTFNNMDVPNWLAREREKKDFPMQADNRREWNQDREVTLRKVRGQYCAMIKHIDDCVGRMLTELEQQGILDNTLILFTTDHGDLMGEQGMTGKNFLYETAYRIPLLMRLPTRIPAGVIIDDMLSTIDIMPTILDLINADHSATEIGRSAAQQLQGHTCAEWEQVVYTHPFGNERVACFTPEWELGFDFHGEPILYNRLHDPEQQRNRYGDPDCAEIIANIRKRMDKHYATHCPRVAHWLPGQHGFATPKPTNLV